MILYMYVAVIVYPIRVHPLGMGHTLEVKHV